jgi:hypothetical protein
MFDDKLFLKSKTYFRMQQLCRIFGDTIEQTSIDLRKTQSILFDQFRKQLTEFWMRGNNSAFESLCKEWDDKTANQVFKLDAILERMRKKGEEVISLRDGVSHLERQLSSFFNLDSSSSTPLLSEKPPKAPRWPALAFVKNNTSLFLR